ncbi:TPR-like protein [Hysterangium stoloniferum]|nr:TPR-like protein [Hysterangium stoloniferum]
MPLDSQAKIEIGKQKKDAGDQAFKAGETKDALRNYHEALLYLNGIEKSAMQAIVPNAPIADGEEKMKTEIDLMVEKIYANQSACHIKNGNWRRALEAADKALSKNENNHKAAFRKGKAQAELGYIERAQKTLGDLLKKGPEDASIVTAEIARIKAADAERSKKLDKKLRGFLSRDKAKEDDGRTSASILEHEEPRSASIAEIDEPLGIVEVED